MALSVNKKALSFDKHCLIGMHSLSGSILWYDLGENSLCLMGVIDPDICSPSLPLYPLLNVDLYIGKIQEEILANSLGR